MLSKEGVMETGHGLQLLAFHIILLSGRKRATRLPYAYQPLGVLYSPFHKVDFTLTPTPLILPLPLTSKFHPKEHLTTEPRPTPIGIEPIVINGLCAHDHNQQASALGGRHSETFR